jgi:hypothetical protein
MHHVQRKFIEEGDSGNGEAQCLAGLEVDDERLTSSHSLRLPREFPGPFQELFTGEHNLFPARDEPPLVDDPLLIDPEEGPLGDPELRQGGIVGETAVLPSDLQIRKVAEQWVRQLERLPKGLLREGMVGTDPENLDVQLLEFGVIGLPGREVGHSRRGKINAIELEEDVLLPPELAEADLVPRRTGKREVRRGLPDPRGGLPTCRAVATPATTRTATSNTPSTIRHLVCCGRVSVSLSPSFTESWHIGGQRRPLTAPGSADEAIGSI